jgi:O-succinylbenzoate synthase
MAKASLETAILDAQLKDQKVSLASYLGATKSKVECGVSVGIVNNLSGNSSLHFYCRWDK